MQGKGVLAVGCLVAGIPLAAWGLTRGSLLPILLGLALVLVFIYLAWEWIAGAGRPLGAETSIRKSADAAWNMKDQPVRPRDEPQDK